MQWSPRGDPETSNRYGANHEVPLRACPRAAVAGRHPRFGRPPVRLIQLRAAGSGSLIASRRGEAALACAAFVTAPSKAHEEVSAHVRSWPPWMPNPGEIPYVAVRSALGEADAGSQPRRCRCLR